MKLRRFRRIAVVVIAAILALGPAAAFAVPMMNSSAGMAPETHGATYVQAQMPCADCPALGAQAAGMSAFCTAGCIAPVMLPAMSPLPKPIAGQEWRITAGVDPPGITRRIEPYPPNLSV
jgi:hypothetical protein